MVWEKLFSKEDLLQGDAMYRQGKAKKLIVENGGLDFSCIVRDDRNYHPEAGFDVSMKLAFASCDCAIGKKGHYCAHLAALLFLSEAYMAAVMADFEDEDFLDDPKEDRYPDSPPKAMDNPLSPPGLNREKEPQNSEYHYFLYDELDKGLGIAPETYREAQTLLRLGTFENEVSLGFSYTSNPSPYNVMGRYTIYSKKRDFRVDMDFFRNRITYSRCTNLSCYTRYNNGKTYLDHNLCVHEVAALIALMDILKRENPGDITDYQALELIKRFKKLSYNKKDTDVEGIKDSEGTKELKKDEPLKLVPYLVEEYGDFKLCFRTGENRLYKIKKLKDFYNKVRNQEEQQFGKNTFLYLSEKRFSGRSLEWYDFLKEYMEEEEERERIAHFSNDFSSSMFNPDGIFLYGRVLDSFLSLLKDDEIEAELLDKSANKKKYLLRPQSMDYKPVLKLTPSYDEAHIFQGVELKGHIPPIYYGKSTACYLDTENSRLVRISDNSFKELRFLAKKEGYFNWGEGSSIEFSVGRNYLADFYRRALPRLSDIANIDDTFGSEVEKYLPLLPSYVFYLDLEGSEVTCRPEVCYEGKKPKSIVRNLDLSVHRVGFGGIEFWQDIEDEMNILDLLKNYFPVHKAGYDRLFTGSEEDIFRLLDHGALELMESGELRGSSKFKKLLLRKKVAFKADIKINSGLIEFVFDAGDLSESELLELFNQYKQKKKYFRLKNGDFVALNQEDEDNTFAKLLELMEASGLSLKEFVKGKMKLPIYRAFYLDRMLDEARDVNAGRDKYFKDLVKDFKTIEDSDFDIPEGLNATLRRYQEVGFKWLKTLDIFHFGGILADDMGLGKTIQAIALILSERNIGKGGTSLVVAPASLIFNWGEELRKFAPSLRFRIVNGTSEEREDIIEHYEDYDVLITSYDLLRRDIAEYEGKTFRFQFLDEAQYIKNAQTAAAKSAKLINSSTRYALTGTPIENRLGELWSIFDYLMPGFLYSHEAFRRDIEIPVMKYGDKHAVSRLKRMAAPFILRRVKADVLKDLPEKLEEIRYSGMGERQQKLYDAEVTKIRDAITKQSDEEFSKKKIELLAELTKVRQICCDPSLIVDNYDGGSAKRETCLELLRGIRDGGHKALLFSQFTTMLDILAQDLDKEGIPFYTITGSTPKEKRLQLVNSFNQDSTPVFLISLKAGGTGLNLIGADTVIHYDPWWNLAAQNQATDRAHRIGQKKIVTIYRLILKDTIEERILKMQEEKQKLSDDILGTESVSSAAFNRDELLELLSGH